MERQDYPAMLAQLQPSQAVEILNDRVRQVGRLNTAIADWLLARRQIEEQYSAGLRKLAQRPLDAGDLGVFSVPWTAISGSAAAMAGAHASLAGRIESELEQPLRAFATKNREMSALPNISGNLATLAKDVEKAQQKSEKIKGKGEKAEANKVANASSELETAQSQWESQAPYVFESLQAADETRINHLRDLLTQFETMETDQLEKCRQSAEQCLNVILNVQTEDEIKTFALKTLQKRPSVQRGPSSIQGTPSHAPTGSLAGTAAIRQDDDRRSQRAASVQSSIPEEKPKSRFGGLKRIGTVVSKKRESRVPQNLPSMSESPEPKPRPSGFGRLGRSKESSSNLATVDEGASSQRPRSPTRLGSELFLSPSERGIEPPRAVSPGAESPDIPPPGPPPSHRAADAIVLPNGSHQVDLAGLEPPKPSEPEVNPPEPIQKDSEGFSVPPADIDPITQAQMEAESAGEGATPQFNVNIRDAPIQNDVQNDDAALANMANKLQAPPPASRRVNTVRGRRGDRNSIAINNAVTPDEQIRETTSEAVDVSTPEPQTVETTHNATPAVATAGVAGIMAVASSVSPFSTQTEQQPSFQLRPETKAISPGDITRGDTHSIRSSTTTGSQTVIKHPDLTGTGLNSSIIETVGARFENGKVTSSTLIGEIALAYKPTDSTSTLGTETIRLDNFPSLEKVAPNPAFVTQSPNKEGEYTINLAGISKTQVAFKYQVGLRGEDSHAPLLITSAFRIEPSQTSVIVSYSLNPSFSLNSKETLMLSNVVIAFTLDGARATGCQSKPVGTFSREKSLVFWQLGDLTLTPGAAPEKLLARFATDAEAKGGSVDAKWEIIGDSALTSRSAISVSTQTQSSGGDGADPFADESAAGSTAWRSVNTIKKIISGQYVAR